MLGSCPRFRGLVALRLLLRRRGVILATNFCNVHLRRRQFQVHVLQCVGDDLGNSQVAKPLVVGRASPNLWPLFEAVKAPILVIRGTESDALFQVYIEGVCTSCGDRRR
jgi:hypothetical protein